MRVKRVVQTLPLAIVALLGNPGLAWGWTVKTIFGISIEGGQDKQAFGSLVNQILDIAYMLAGGCATIMIIYGGIRYVTAAGNPKVAQEAKEIIVSALTGLVLVLIAYLIASLIGGESLTNPSI
jgi:hypothetical protein